MAYVAAALDCSIAKISRLERGHISNLRFLHQYRDWLTNPETPTQRGLTTIGASPAKSSNYSTNCGGSCHCA